MTSRLQLLHPIFGQNFGNEADAITAAEVSRVRAFVGERKDTWTWEELTKPENQGIPGGE